MKKIVDHYVYQAIVNGVVKYIGSGKGNRYRHCTSGRSSCAELNRDYWLNEYNIKVVIVKDGMTKDASLLLEKELIESNEAHTLYNKDIPTVRGRKDKGLKTNLITANELKSILTHWLSNGRSNLRRSFTKIYDNTGKINKDLDWVTAMLGAKHFGKELTQAFISMTNNRSIDLLKNSRLFDLNSLSYRISLSERIRRMAIELQYAEELLEQKEEITRLKAELSVCKGHIPWREAAMKLLATGTTQREVALRVGKSLSTVKRLINQHKEK